MKEIVFETVRLKVQIPTSSKKDVDFYFRLWNDPEVMRLVGFPRGLLITKDKISDILRKNSESEFDRTLIVVEKETGKYMGEAKIGFPKENGIAETDIKLLPQFREKGFGSEVKQSLVDYIFENTDATAVEATPNKKNIASQRLQVSVGAEKIGEGVYHFPENMKSYTEPVPHLIYRLSREAWERRKKTK